MDEPKPGYSEFKQLADRTTVVLVSTRYGGNIGAVARAMHNFGFARLRLVSPRGGIDEDARRLAVYSGEILDRTEIYDTFETAIAGADIIAGTTRRMGKRRGRFFRPPQFAGEMLGLPSDKNVALVFGAEDTGLTNEQLDLCNRLVTIPTASEFDSLNLSHAAAVVLYEISRCFDFSPREKAERERGVEELLIHFEQSLRAARFLPPEGDPLRVMLSLRGMLSQAGWSRRETELMHAILQRFERAMDENK